MKLVGVVLAGGASSRFGGAPKGMALLNGKPMAAHVGEILRGMCSEIAIEAKPGAGYEALGAPVIAAAPEHGGKGPLAGMAAGLAFAQSQGAEAAAFAPCDTPFLKPADFQVLLDAIGEAPAVFALSEAGAEPLVSIVRTLLYSELETALARPAIAPAHRFLTQAGAIGVGFSSSDAFRNINTPEDLAAAQSGA